MSVACNDDYMEKYPLDKISDANFWNSASDVKLYVNQFYPSFTKTNYFRFDNNSDNQGPSTRDSYVWNESVVPATGGGWAKSDWLGIRRCNYALDRIANMDKDAEMLMYEAEIRFFKSYYYFIKLKYFGDVPWLDHELQTNSEDLYKGRDSRELIVTNMLADLDFAIANLPEKSDADRLTKYAALAFKVEVCLYEGTFRKYHNKGNYEALLREAVNASESVINSGLFSVYSTGKPNEDYFNLFVQYELKGNPEGIMVERYVKDLRMHNNIRLLGESLTGYTKDFVSSYLCTDGLPISLSPLYKGDAVFGDEFVNRDPRMQQSVYNTGRPYRIFDDGTIVYQTMPLFNYMYCWTSYLILKGYSPYERDRQENQSVTDLFIFRYGQLLVSYAEAKAELGECTQGVLDKSINKLRDRVNMPHLTVNVGFIDPNWPNWEVMVTPLINEIRRERRIELAGEGDRWDDLVRWKAGKLLENAKTYLGARDPQTGDYHILYPGYTRKWDDKLYLHPIPTQELLLNKNLGQNSGW